MVNQRPGENIVSTRGVGCHPCAASVGGTAPSLIVLVLNIRIKLDDCPDCYVTGGLCRNRAHRNFAEERSLQQVKKPSVYLQVRGKRNKYARHSTSQKNEAIPQERARVTGVGVIFGKLWDRTLW